MRKTLSRVAIGVFALLAGALIYYWPLIDQLIRFSPMVEAADFDAPNSTLEAQQQDFEYLSRVLEYDRSFSPDAKREFLRRIDTLRGRNAALGKAAFFMETHALMAIADNAHTGADYVSAFREFNRMGVDFYRFQDGMFIVRAHRSHRELLGMKLVSVDGNSTDRILDSLAEYSGGPRARRDLISLYFLRSPALLRAANLAASADRVTLLVEGSDGQRSEHILEAMPSAAETEFAYRHPYHTLLPTSLPDEDGEWVRMLGEDGTAAPTTLTDDGDLVKVEGLSGGLYVRSNYLWECPGQPVETELVEALESPPPGGYAFVFVDLRWNPGGRFGHAIPFAKKVGDTLSPQGKIYLAVGPQTFSAAIVMAALIKQHAGDRAVIVGQPMGDRPQFWAERGQDFVLPNSGYFIGYATGFHDWERKCGKEIEYCFPPSRQNADDIGRLGVEVAIEPTFGQYSAGRDPVLEWALEQD